MLPDFPLSVTLDDGARRRVIARDVSAAVFFYGFPDAVPFAECWQRQDARGQARLTVDLERWIDALLTRVVVRPRLTLELVQRLGDPARTELSTGYLQTVGFLPPPSAPAWSEDEELVVVRRAERLEREEHVALRALTLPPGPNLRAALRLLAAKARQRPSALWALPISEWLFDWRVLLQDSLTARAPFTNDPELAGDRP